MAGSNSRSNSGLPFKIDSNYLIAYRDTKGKLSFRVVRYEDAGTYDRGAEEWRTFKPSGIQIWRKIREEDVSKAVEKHYSKGKAKYYKPA